MKEKSDSKMLLEIFITFLKIGAFTFGGGYAMIPLIEREIIENKGWIKDQKEIIDLFAVSESIPGAIAINSSTIVGYKILGRKGAIAAMVGVILPSFFIITLIAAFFSKFQENVYVQAAFVGIRSSIVAFILKAAYDVARNAIKDYITLGIFILTLFLINVHPIFTIITGASVGILLYFVSLLQIESNRIREEGKHGLLKTIFYFFKNRRL